MKRYFILLSMLLCCGWQLLAQEANDNRGFSFGFYMNPVVRSYSEMDAMNATFTQNNLPKMSDIGVYSEAGMSIRVNRLSLVFGSMFGSNIDNDMNYDISSTVQTSTMRVYFDVLKSPKIDLSPFVGMNVENYVWEVDKENPATLDAALAPDYTNSSYSLSAINHTSYDFGLALSFRILKLLNGFSDLKVGLEGGYVLADEGDWRLNDEAVDIADTNMGGFEAKLNLQFNINFRKPIAQPGK